MNYHHSYHAGNFADVHKHVILVALVRALQKKDTPFCYLDTHAGAGIYDLSDESAQKTGEYKNGIAKIWSVENPLDLMADYLSCVRSFNPDGQLKYYPGSPAIVRYLLRPQDRMILTERHDGEYQALKKHFRGDKQVAVHHQNGWQGLKAYLPFKERRGLILIDPPYENNDELLQLPDYLAEALRRFETGVYAFWYPIKRSLRREAFYRDLKTKINRPVLLAEMKVMPEESFGGLCGSGMGIINPPWQFAVELKDNWQELPSLPGITVQLYP